MKLTRSHLLFLAASSSVIAPAFAANGTWSTDVAGNWSDGTKWTSTIIADGINATADFSTLNIAAGRTVTIDTTSRTLGTIKFGDTGATGDSAWTLAATGGANLTLATGTAVQPVIDMGSTGIAGSFAQHTVTAPLAGTAGFNLTGSNQIVFNTGSLTSISGTATVSAGRLALQGTDLGGITAIDVKSGGHLGLWNTGGSYSQSISLAGTGNGEIGFEAALRSANAGATVTFGGPITLTGNATIGGRNGGTGGTIFNGSIGESGGSRVLTIGTASLNNGTYALNNSSNYSGGTVIAFGTVTAGNNQALGLGSVTVNNGAILNVNGSTLANATTLTGGTVTNASATGGAVGGITLSTGRLSTVSTTGTGTLTLGSLTRQAAAFVNFTNTTASTISSTSGTASTVLADPVTGAPYATFGGTDWAAKDAANTFITGLSTIGGYTAFPAAGTVTFSGNSDLTDATTVNPVYTLAADSATSTIRAITAPAATSTSTTIALNASTLITGGILSSQTLTISGAGSLQAVGAGGELVFNQSTGTATITSTVADNTAPSSFVKTGGGAVVLNALSNYTGMTYVNQGTLKVTTGSSSSGFTLAPSTTLVVRGITLGASQNITGAGGISKDIAAFGDATINGTNNNFTGSTDANVSKLTVGSGGVINGTSSISVAGNNTSTLVNNGSITTIGALTVNGGNATDAGLFTNGDAGGTTPGTLNAASMTLGAANTQTAGTAHGGAFTNNLNSSATVSGALTVNGQGSATTIASSATGSLFTNSGGTVTLGSLTLNNSATGNTFSNKGGTYTQTAGTTTSTGALSLVATGTDIATGAAGNDAAFNLSGGTATFGSASLNGTTTVSGTGTLNVSGSFNMGDLATDRSGTFIQTGGTTNLTTSSSIAIRIGHWGSETSVFNLSAGTLNVLNTSMNVGWDGTGALNLSGTGTANLKQLSLGSNGGGGTGNGSLTLTGGTLNIGTGGITTPNGLGTKTLNLGAGTVGAFGGNWSSSLAMSLTDTVTGVTFNTLDSVDLSTGRTITLSGAISGAGKLIKTGAGTLTLSGATNSYTGATTVTGGILSLANPYLADASTVTIGTGATLNLTHSADDIVDALFVDGVQQAPGLYKSSTGIGAGTVLASLTGTGKLQVTTGPSNTFASWMATYSFAAYPGANLTANGDADGDGIANVIENVFGTAPNAPTPGLTQIGGTAPSLTFKHRLNPAIASNVTYAYQWSSDLSEWKSSGQSNTGGTTATINAGAPVSGEVTVTTTINAGPSTKLFVRVIANETP